MKYFAFHECTVLICGGLYYFQPDIGVLCLSILPGISIISVFLHFLLTQFKNINLKNIKNNEPKNDDDERDEEAIKTKISSTYYSCKHYLVALLVFIIGLSSIYLIYITNTYLSTLVPIRYDQEEMSETMSFIGKILQFPHSHSMRHRTTDFESRMRPFNYRISFVGSIIAPVIEESFKYLLVFLTFPIVFIWSFVNRKLKNKHGLIFMPTYSDYCIESLFVMFIAVCGGCGIAIMENLGYLAACQWTSTRPYCLPNRNFDILGAGLARGIFSVPFHCATACIMADIVCMWMNTNIKCFNKNKYTLALKFILSYPISIILPVFLHSSFNYWMKGIPFMTGCITIFGFSFLTMRISTKHAYINGIDENQDKDKNENIDNTERKSIESIDSDKIDLTISDPFPGWSDVDDAVAL